MQSELEKNGLDIISDDIAEVKPKRKKKKFIIAGIIILIIAGGIFAAVTLLSGRGNAAGLVPEYTYHTVGTRDITVKLSGTGTLQPADSYTLTALIAGEILEADFEEGDIVEADEILYKVDNSDMQSTVERAENSLAQSRRSYEQKLKSLDELNIKAPESGTVAEILVESGDKVSGGQTVAKIRNNSTMTLIIPFSPDDADSFYTGASAEVTIDGSFETIYGTVTKINPVEQLLSGNMPVKYVTIDVINPGGISPGLSATAHVNGAPGVTSAEFAYKGESTVTASVSGEVSYINVKEGGTVNKDQVIVTLTSESLTNDVLNSQTSLHDAEISLENQYERLDDYIITSPISGTVIEKYYKQGDKMESGKSLCTVFDLSYLTMTLNIDELDISKIEVGQKVSVTAEAVTGKAYEGIVTKININGTTSGGVTVYPVTIRIDETDGLLPGMNVDAEIIVSSSENAIAIPVGAVSRGNRVLVKTGGAAQNIGDGTIQRENNDGQRPDNAQGGGQRPDNAQGGGQRPDNAQGGGQRPDNTQGETAQNREQTGNTTGASLTTLPEGFAYVQVTLGASDDEYIEVLSGLNAGDEIAILEIPTAASSMQQGNMVMMPGGPMPAGGGTMVVTGGGPAQRPAGGSTTQTYVARGG